MKILPSNRKYSIALLLFGVLGGLLAAWAFWYEPSRLIVKNYEIKVDALNSSFKHVKIAVISDIHGGSNFVTEEKIQTVVELANAQNPDLIVLLGDFVAEKRNSRLDLKMPMAIIADNLRGLRAKHGVFAVIGNHDVWYSETKVVAELERVGIRVLNGEAARIETDEQKFILLGLPEVLKYSDARKFSQDAENALAKLDDLNSDVIALVHNPDAFVWITGENSISDNLRLVLAGHTHGGQCDFPFLGSPITPSSYGQKYAKGLIMENNRQMFVTPGIGTSILPVRFRVPPEISVLSVNSQQSAVNSQ